nr:hypothetical protein [Tanacetum cinerariifolium]
MVGEMHNEAQQAAGGPTSLRAIRCDASTDSTVEADDEISAPNDSIPSQQVYKEGFRALESIITSKLQMAFMWSVKGGALVNDSFRHHLETKSDTSLKYFEFGCEGYSSATSLLVVMAISPKENSTWLEAEYNIGVLLHNTGSRVAVNDFKRNVY